MSITVKVRGYMFMAGLLCLAMVSFSTAQDPAKIAPESYKSALENEYIRIHNVTIKAGAKVAMHSHPDHLVYAQSDGKLKFTYADGKSKDIELKKGTVTWVKSESHSVENTGSVDFKGVVVELMKPATPGAKPVTMPEAQDSAKVAADTSKVLFENERVRVLNVNFKPGAKQPMHAHPNYASYALSDLKVKFTMPDGTTTDKTLAAGQASWSGPTVHAVEFVGAAEGSGLVFELRDPIAAVVPTPEAQPKKAPAAGH